MLATVPPSGGNRLLAGLTPGDGAALAAVLESVDLPRRRSLEQRHRRVEHIYFIDSGVASVVAGGADVRSVEVGMIGREGLTGLAALMGAPKAAYDVFIQVAGHGRRVAATVLAALLDERPSLRAAVLRFAYALMVQVGATARANARAKLEERLARWLLMTRDRIEGDEFELTHEFLATMLGVRRAGVSVAMKHLESRGLVELRRGAIHIVDREGLVMSSNGAYGDLDRGEAD